MISNALRTDIERWVTQKDQNPVIQLAKSGQLTKTMVARYIANMTFIVGLAPTHLRRAEEVARARGDDALARHFAHKFDEEAGHAVWGEADLERLATMVPPGADTSVTPSMTAQAAFIRDAIEKEPGLYLVYIAFVEYITVLLGGEFLTLIEDYCGVPKAAMTVIGNHIELDIEHAEEGFGVIDDLVGDPRRIGPMRKALAQVMSNFDGFCAEIVSTADGILDAGTTDVLESGVIDIANGPERARTSAA